MCIRDRANSMASGLKESLSIPPFITGAVVTLVVAAVILGGVKRIAAVKMCIRDR